MTLLQFMFMMFLIKDVIISVVDIQWYSLSIKPQQRCPCEGFLKAAQCAIAHRQKALVGQILSNPQHHLEPDIQNDISFYHQLSFQTTSHVN